MDKVVHFEIPSDDRESAKRFYSTVFGWETGDMPFADGVYTYATTSPVDENHMPLEKGSINGGIFQREAVLRHPIITIGVASIEDAAKRIEASGGAMVVPAMEVPGMGYAAYFRDPEGNIMGLWQDLQL